MELLLSSISVTLGHQNSRHSGVTTGGCNQSFRMAAAAARVMGAAGALYHANTLTSSFLLKPFSITHKAIRLNRNLNAAPRRLFACRALYKPGVQIKEEGQPETLDYRVFLVDQSGKKVPIHLYFSSSA